MVHTGKSPGLGSVCGNGFDSVENTALFSILQGNIIVPYPQVAACCATIKFALILLGLSYGLAGWLLPEKHR
jgi:hypothetical protein